MANYIDYLLPGFVSSEFSRIATGKTDIITLDNGDEIRNARWKYPKMQFSADYTLMSPEAREAIVSAFYAARAQLYLFRFHDPGDFRATMSPITPSADTTDAVQLYKRYTFGPSYADRLIQAIRTCTVYDEDGAEVSGDYDAALGLFTPTSSWGSGSYYWSGVFDCWVRFDSDEFEMNMVTREVTNMSSLALIEQKAHS